MELKVLKLGTFCHDKATGLKGTLTHWIVDMGKAVDYLFQPTGLDEEGQPLKKLILEQERLRFDQDDFETVEIPFEILGTIVTDKASGFTGMAVQFIRHINGCFHVTIQPQGVLPKTKEPIKECEFDLRECTGEQIEPMSEKKLQQSKKDSPSPTGDKLFRKRADGC